MITFDLTVIGAGPGGYVAAIRAAQLGLKVALIEKEEVLGGTCLRIGCIPSKALLESSELVYQSKHHLADHGISVGDVTYDLSAMMARKEKIVGDLTGGIGLLMKKNKVSVYRGTGRIASPGKVVVSGPDGSTEIKTTSILIATGSAPAQVPGLEFDGERIVSSTEALAFEKAPEHLLVVGGGAIGLELGSVWCRLGSKVTVVELLPRLVPFADKQTAQILQRTLKGQGLDIRVQSKVTSAKVSKKGVSVTVQDKKGKEETLECDRLLVAVGRKPFTDDLGAKEAGVELDEAGRVKVNSNFETNIRGIYAIGDVIAGPMLAHKAEEEGVACAEILAGKAGHVNYNTIPSVVYTDPELAQVGLTEDQAKEQGIAVKAGKFFFKANGRAKSLGSLDGFVKVLARADTDKVVGVHIVGPRASELIAEAVTAMEFSSSSEDIARTIHAHPTLSEVMKEAALAVEKRAIHG